MGKDFRADIDTLSSRLGPPTASGSSENGLPTRTWRKGDASLTATYKTLSKRVVSLSVIALPESDAVRDDAKLSLLKTATLPESEGSGAYSIEWIEAREKATFVTGFRVVPAPKSHRVALRLLGTKALVTVAFSPTTTPSPEAGPGGGTPFITIPPWQTTLEVPDDGKIALASRIERNLDPTGKFSMRLQIEVDGKVVQDKTSTGLPLSVEWEI